MMARVRFGLTLAVLVAAGVLSGCAQEATRPTRIDPRADEPLRKMSAALGGAKSFSFRGIATMEEPLATGQLATFSRETRVLVRRPDRFFAESRRGEDAWVLWYAGGSLTILNKGANTCATVQVPGRIDDMLDHVAEKYDLTMPLADLLFSDPYKVLTADAFAGKYVGVHDVNGARCEHLLFTQENVDWQVWIHADGEPLPAKLVIDYKNRPGRPQFTAMLTDWNLSAEAGDDQFRPSPPENARKVEMADLLAAEQDHR